jgi:hypothetical protein
LNDCQTTIDGLEKALVDIRAEGKNFAKQAVRRIKLNLMDSEITTFRAQIRTHTNALQMALQMVNLRAAYLAPGAVTDELGPKIDKLREIMELVHGSEADLKLKSLGVEPEYLTGLRMSAQRVISGATTVSANSEADGSIWDDMMNEEMRDKTLSWVSDPVTQEGYSGLRIAPPPSDNYSSSQTVDCDDSNARVTDSDSDDNFESEKVETSFALGTRKFNDGHFAEALPNFQRCLELAEKLPFKRKQLAQIAEIKLMIATCIYYSPNFSEAESRLIPIIEEKTHENVTDEGAIRRCQASYLLAGILFRQGKYKPATSFCEKALLGRRRVLGKNHISYYESLSLLSQICEADGLQEDAEMYSAMIPNEVAPKLVKMKDRFPDMLQGPPKSLQTGGLLPTTVDNSGCSLSLSETQFMTITDGASIVPTTSGSSQPLQSSSQNLPPAPQIPRLASASTLRSKSISSASTETAASSVSAEGSVRRKFSFRKLGRHRTSTPSMASPAPIEVSVVKEEDDISVSGQQSFRDYLIRKSKLENIKDENVYWPGLA